MNSCAVRVLDYYFTFQFTTPPTSLPTLLPTLPHESDGRTFTGLVEETVHGLDENGLGNGQVIETAVVALRCKWCGELYVWDGM